MTKKIYTGILIGVAAGVSIPFLVNYLKRNNFFAVESDSSENDMLDKANDYLLIAREKVEKMVKDAEVKSQSIIDEASDLLSIVKEKTARMHDQLETEIPENAEIIKEEIKKQIDDFRNKI